MSTERRKTWDTKGHQWTLFQYTHPALRAADHLGKHHKPPIPHDLGLYRASAAPAEGKLYLQADDRCGELHPAPYLRTDHRGKMAEVLFMSRPYLSRKFKEKTGESLTDFILYEKTEEAKRLLRYSDKPITAISSYLGFSSPSHFSRVFKARVCITPGEYREKHQ